MASLTRGLQLLGSAVRYAVASAGLVTPLLLASPTPCTEWDLEGLLDHVSDSAGVLRQAITAGCAGLVPPPGGGPPGDGPPAGGSPGDSLPGDGPPAGGSPGDSLPGDGPPDGGSPGDSLPGDGPPMLGPVRGLYQQTGRLLAACAAAGPAQRLVAVGDRELTTNMVVLAGALEIAVHGWDISVSCGARQPIPPGLSAIMLPLAPLLVTPATRPGLFADPVPVPRQASPGDQLVAFLGRRPCHPRDARRG